MVQAYHVLSDPEKRKVYDQFGDEGVKVFFFCDPEKRRVYDQFGENGVLGLRVCVRVCVHK